MKKNGEHFVTCGQMKVLERRADENGLSYYQMMENAGTGAAAVIMDNAAYWNAGREENQRGASILAAAEAVYKAEGLPPSTDRTLRTVKSMRAYIFCGKGNNGGDGFVVARVLHDKGYEVTVVLVDGKPKTADAVTNFGLLENRNIKIIDMAENNRALLELEGDPDIIIDAIYGTGFKGELKSNGLKAAIYINRYSKGEYGIRAIAPVMVASLDIPSGMGGDVINEKELDQNSITAHFTVTFHAKKPVHLQSFSEKHCGEIFVVDIGIDEEKLWNIEI